MESVPSVSSKRYYLMKARLIALLGRQEELLRHYQSKKQLSEIDQYTQALLLLKANRYKAAEEALSKTVWGRHRCSDRLRRPKAKIQESCGSQPSETPDA